MADVISGSIAGHFDDTGYNIVVPVVLKSLLGTNKLMPYVQNVSNFHMKGTKTIDFPSLTEFTALNRTLGTAGDATALTDAATTLALDQTPYVSYLIDSAYGPATAINAQVEYAERAGAAMGRFLENLIRAELEAAASFTEGILTAITFDAFLNMREALCTSNAEDLVLYVGCDNEKALWKINEFVRFDAMGSSPAPLANGKIGSIMGVPVIMSSLVPAGDVYLFDSRAVAIGFSQDIKIASQAEIQYGTSAERVAYDAMVGVKALRPEWIAKLN